MRDCCDSDRNYRWRTLGNHEMGGLGLIFGLERKVIRFLSLFLFLARLCWMQCPVLVTFVLPAFMLSLWSFVPIIYLVINDNVLKEKKNKNKFWWVIGFEGLGFGDHSQCNGWQMWCMDSWSVLNLLFLSYVVWRVWARRKVLTRVRVILEGSYG